MIDCQAYYELLERVGIKYFVGVPDSLLKDFCFYVLDRTDLNKNIIAANEGTAIALAAGHYLATGEFALVYMQNSGLGNAVNPLTSLVDPDVYSIPLLLFIGWRGEPGRKDEPQHVKQGKITLSLLDTLGIHYEVHPETLEESEAALHRAVDHMIYKESPFAFVLRAKTFSPYLERKSDSDSYYELTREDALRETVENLSDDAIIVSTTGKLSRELFECRVATRGKHEGDFLTVGSMGHASQIALAVALAKPNKQIFCLDGDGAFIMHMGSVPIIGSRKPSNFRHIVFNNGSHDSVGGQPTVGYEIDIPAIARACGYLKVLRIQKREEIGEAVRKAQALKGPVLIEILVKRGARLDLGRPTIAPVENKNIFMKNLAK